MGHYTDEREAPDWMGFKPKTLPKEHVEFIAEFWKEMAGRSLTPTGVERTLEAVLAKHQTERAGFDTIAQKFRTVFGQWNAQEELSETVAMEKALEAIQPMVWPAKVYTVNVVGPATINHTGDLTINRPPDVLKKVSVKFDETAPPASAPEFRILDTMTVEQRAALLKLKTEAGSSQVRLEEAMAAAWSPSKDETRQRLMLHLSQAFSLEISELVIEAIEELIVAAIREKGK